MVKYAGPCYTKAYEGLIKAIGLKSPSCGVLLELARYLGKGTRETKGMACDKLAVSCSAQAIADRWGCPVKRVYRAIETLKGWEFFDEVLGRNRPFIENAPEAVARRHHAAVYLVNVPQESQVISPARTTNRAGAEKSSPQVVNPSRSTAELSSCAGSLTDIKKSAAELMADSAADREAIFRLNDEGPLGCCPVCGKALPLKLGPGRCSVSCIVDGVQAVELPEGIEVYRHPVAHAYMLRRTETR